MSEWAVYNAYGYTGQPAALPNAVWLAKGFQSRFLEKWHSHLDTTVHIIKRTLSVSVGDPT